MTTRAHMLKRSLAVFALLGVISTAALGLSNAHAGPAPHIAVDVQQYASVLHVRGSGFGPGDPVMVFAINNDTHKVITSVQTTAAPRPAPHQPTVGVVSPVTVASNPLLCALKTSHCPPTQPGAINTVTPPYPVHCGLVFVTVYATDVTTGSTSNPVQATLGLGPC
jgi:hypothetical protein